MFGLHTSISHLVTFFCQSIWHQIICKLRGLPARTEEDVQEKVVFITGANTGIGKCVAEGMAKRGATVIMACRNMAKGKEALVDIRERTGSHNLELVELDLSDFSSIRKCCEYIAKKYPVIDILINNAGIAFHSSKKSFTQEGHEIHFATNHLGHFLLTNLLLGSIHKAKAGRIITIASSILVLANLSMKDFVMQNLGMGLFNIAPYSNSKFANALFTKELAKRLAKLGSRVKTYSICPGLVDTNLSQNLMDGTLTQNGIIQGVLRSMQLSVEEGADGILFCALAKGIESNSGKMFRFGQVLTSVESMLTDSLAEELWKNSENLVSLSEKCKNYDS